MTIPFSVYDFFAYLATGFILLAACDYAFDINWLVKEKLPPGMIMLLVVASYILGHITANVSSFFIEHKFLRGILKSPEETLFKEPSKGFWPGVFPIFFQPFPPETQRRVLDKAKAFGIHNPGRGLFFHCFAIVKRDKGTMDRLNTFLNTYGFCRNACLACLVAAGILVIAGIVHPGGARLHKLELAFVGVLISIGLLYRYLKFFKHYTEEVFRTYAEYSSQTPSKAETE